MVYEPQARHEGAHSAWAALRGKCFVFPSVSCRVLCVGWSPWTDAYRSLLGNAHLFEVRARRIC